MWNRKRKQKLEQQLLNRFWRMAETTATSALHRRTEGFVLGALTKIGFKELADECRKVLFPTEKHPLVIPARKRFPLSEYRWHHKYLCVSGHKAPHGLVDHTQPLKGVWMCGTHGSKKDFKNCKGHELIGEDAEFCRHFGECGECTLAGRPTTYEEIRGDT
jgi:hypothetical protein